MVVGGDPVPVSWQRWPLVVDGVLQEHRVRAAAVAIARCLAGGADGFSCDYGEHAGQGHDPDGHFAAVTEGRQCSWRDPQGNLHRYSACEDLPVAVYYRLIGAPQGEARELMSECLQWCNCEAAGNRWRQGENLIRIKRKLKAAWHRQGQAWGALAGDALQVIGRHGPHTMIVTGLQHNHQGEQVAVDHADYGQWHRPVGASQPGPSCRCYRAELLTRGAHGWYLGGRQIHGWVDCVAVVQHVLEYVGASEMLDAVVPV